MNPNHTPAAWADEARIRWLIERYFMAIDSKDAAQMRSCFTEDCKLVYHQGEAREVRVADREALLRYLLGGTAWNGPSIHALSNCAVTVDGETARASTYAIAYLVVEGKVHVRGLRYDDQLVLQGPEWRIRERSHKAVWQFEAQSLPSVVPVRVRAMP